MEQEGACFVVAVMVEAVMKLCACVHVRVCVHVLMGWEEGKIFSVR